MAECRLTFQVLHHRERAIAHGWRVEQTPRVFLLNADLRLLYWGAIDNYRYSEDTEHEPYLEFAVEAFLAGRSVQGTETPSFGCPSNSSTTCCRNP